MSTIKHYLKTRKSRLTGGLLVVCGAAIWGTSGTAQALGPPEAIPVTVAALRMILAGLLLFLIAATRRSINLKGKWPLLPVLVSVLGMTAFQPSFFSGVRLTGVAVGTIVVMGSAPVISGLLSYLFLKEVPEKVWYYSTFFAVTGCVLLVITGSGDTVVNPTGVLFSLIAGVSFSLYILGSKALLAYHPPEAVNALVFAVSAILLSPIIFIYPVQWVFQISGVLTVLYLGIISSVVAYLLFSFGLSLIPTSTSVTLTLAEPLTAALLGFLLLGEQLTWLNFLGSIMLFVSLVLLTVKGKK